MRRISILNQPAVVLSDRETILAAALDAGVPYPHDCRTGSCGSCKSKLLEGEVEMLPHPAEGLDDEEAADRLILACRACAKTDIVVEWLGEADDEAPPVRGLDAEVCDIGLIAPAVSRLRLSVAGQPMFFAAGQYAELRFGRTPARAFSMANVPSDPVLEFHIRHINGVASGHVAEKLKIGDPVRLKGPYGSAYFRPHGRPILAIAGGVGMAPLHSIIRTALNRDPDARIDLYWGVRDEPDLYGGGELDALATRHPNFRFVPVLSAPNESTEHRIGMVHEAVEQDFARLSGHVVHIAGPPEMVDRAKDVAMACGADPSAIYSDPFLPPAKEEAGGFLRSVFSLGALVRRPAG
ncbi:MAG: 2Fe-2S iron-sulfur cluster-binding protein [Pseudomonadota bacterium]